MSGGEEGEVSCGELHLFFDLPGVEAREALAEGALAAMREALDTYNPAHLKASPLLAKYGARTRAAIIERVRPPYAELKANRAATVKLAKSLSRAAKGRDGGDAGAAGREAARLFREVVVARWIGERLLATIEERMAPASGAIIGERRLPGGVMLRLVAQTGHDRGIRAVAFGPEGRRLVTVGDDGRVIGWDAATGREIQTWWYRDAALRERPLGEIASVALAPDGKLLLLGDEGGRLLRWDPVTGPRVVSGSEESPGSGAAVPAVRGAGFSSDGGTVISVGRTATLWASDTERQRLEKRATLELAAGAPEGVAALSPRADLVVIGGANHTAVVWEVERNEVVATLVGHAAAPCAAAFSGDGSRVATLDVEGTACLWEPRTGARLRQVRVGDGAGAIALSPDGALLLVSSPSGGAQLWELGAEPPAPRAVIERALAGIGEPVTTVALSPAAATPLLVAGTATGAVWAIDYRSGEVAWSMPAMRLAATRAVFDDDSLGFAITDETGRVYEWDGVAGRLARCRAAGEAPGEAPRQAPSGEAPRQAPSGEAPRQAPSGEAPRQALSPDAPPAPSRAAPPSPDDHPPATPGNDPPPSPSLRAPGELVIERVSVGQVIRLRESGQAIGHYQPRRGNQLTFLEVSASRRRVLLFHEDGSAGAFEMKPPAQAGPLEPWLLWQARLRHVGAVALSPDGRLVLAAGNDGVSHLWEVASGERLCDAIGLPDGRWAVSDDEGRFDAANGGAAAGLHWVLDVEPIELEQLKARYYDPFLLAKKLGANPEPLRELHAGLGEDGAPAFAPKLAPSVKGEVDASAAGGPVLRVTLIDRGGGIGPVRVALNGKEAFVCAIEEEAGSGALRARIDGREVALETRSRGAGEAPEVVLTWSLAGHPFLLASGDNRVQVTASDRDERLSSREVGAWGSGAGGATTAPSEPHLWAIVAGVSTYAGPTLRLRYAGRDAQSFGAALRLGGTALFGEERVHMTVLSTENEAATWPTRANIEAAFVKARAARSGDVLVAYLAGHGAQHREGDDDDFYFLAQDAVSGALDDPEARRRSTISSADMTGWIQQIPALKQVLVLDTCHAGQLVLDLATSREVPSSHVRAIERMKDRMGLFILAGAAADAVSYEASRYAQGLLTYALLFGMRGPALREGKLVDVHDLLNHAVEQVPHLAEGIGGIQRPLLAVPRGGGSFDIGVVEGEARAHIPLASVLTVVVRASFQDEDELLDGLDLGEKTDEVMRVATAGPGAPPFVFIEGNTFPGALRLVGRYKVKDGEIEVTARLVRGREPVRDVRAHGRSDAVEALARRLVDEIGPALRGVVPAPE